MKKAYNVKVCKNNNDNIFNNNYNNNSNNNNNINLVLNQLDYK